MFVNHNSDYKDLYSVLFNIYTSKAEEFNVADVPAFLYHTKLNTALINHEFTESLQNLYKQSLFYIGNAHKIVPLNKNLLETRYFNDKQLAYHISEFGYIPKGMKWNYNKILDMAFSASSFRTMCVKAEIATFILFYLLNQLLDDPEKKNINHKIVFGAFKYAIDKSRKFTNNENVRAAIYVWELTTFINVFGDLNLEFEDTYCLPTHHIFKTTHRFKNISDFADYQNECFKQYITDKSTTQEKEFINRLSLSPKSNTSISYSEDAIFYNPCDSITKFIYTRDFDEHIKVAKEFLEYVDIHNAIYELCKINEYEFQFQLAPNESYDPIKFITFTLIEASELAKNLKIPEGFPVEKLYIMIKLTETEISYFKYNELINLK